jgi:heme exporter protein C
MKINKHIYKIAAVLLLIYGLVWGLLGPVPAREILNETIRNLYFHVPMWFVMMVMFGASAFYAIKHLRSNNLSHDLRSVSFANIGILFSILGMVTGMQWAQYTWGAAWSNDPKQLGTAICMLTYFAYAVLRSGIDDPEKKAKISAVYNIFIFALMIPLIYIMPRMVDSLHPGSGGNPAFNAYDLDHNMRLVFYPIVIGWILLGFWISNLYYRILHLKALNN